MLHMALTQIKSPSDQCSRWREDIDSNTFSIRWLHAFPESREKGLKVGGGVPAARSVSTDTSNGGSGGFPGEGSCPCVFDYSSRRQRCLALAAQLRAGWCP